MLSPSAEHYSGCTPMRDCAELVTVVECCLPPQNTTVVVLLWMTVQHAQLVTVRRRCLPPPAAVVRLQCRIGIYINVQQQGMLSNEIVSPSSDHCALRWTQNT